MRNRFQLGPGISSANSSPSTVKFLLGPQIRLTLICAAGQVRRRIFIRLWDGEHLHTRSAFQQKAKTSMASSSPPPPPSSSPW
mmetsp:Transcript_21935/g.35207  ORF Transcript_21935/g.35207 Transcript_21935/m.35207 type:complete len:83 (+) Transcript_21935:128-376(+)